MMTMELTEIIPGENGFGEIRLLSDGKKAGKMEISREPNLLTVYHTEVDESYAGKGFGKILLKALVDLARKEGLKIKPLCPYVHLQFKRHEADYQDIWYKQKED